MRGIDRVTAGRVRLLFENPFFGMLATDMKMVETDQVPTAGVDGTHLFFNPEFTDKLSKNEIEFLLSHEVLHLVLLTHLRRGHRDMKVWNIATDFAINLMLKDEKFTLIEGSLIDERFRDWSAEKIYEFLMENPEEQPQGEAWNVGAVSDATGGSGEDGKDGKQLTPAQISELEAEMKGKIQAAAMGARKAGKLPGSIESLIEDICAPKADWRDILQRFVSEKAMLDYNFSLCHTRMLQQYGVINPVLSSEELGRLALIIDTSGSVRDEELKQFLGELSDILENYEECNLDVLTCDTKVHTHQEFTSDDLPLQLKIVGRGGTLVKPAMDFIEKNLEKPSAIIYYSDSYAFDYAEVEEPEVPFMLAHTEANIANDVPEWAELIDISG